MVLLVVVILGVLVLIHLFIHSVNYSFIHLLIDVFVYAFNYLIANIYTSEELVLVVLLILVVWGSWCLFIC